METIDLLTFIELGAYAFTFIADFLPFAQFVFNFSLMTDANGAGEFILIFTIFSAIISFMTIAGEGNETIDKVKANKIMQYVPLVLSGISLLITIFLGIWIKSETPADLSAGFYLLFLSLSTAITCRSYIIKNKIKEKNEELANKEVPVTEETTNEVPVIAPTVPTVNGLPVIIPTSYGIPIILPTTNGVPVAIPTTIEVPVTVASTNEVTNAEQTTGDVTNTEQKANEVTIQVK